MKRVSYESFKDCVDLLEKNNLIRKGNTLGYKKTFREILTGEDMTIRKGNCFYVKSILDGYTYCFSNGEFKEHLDKNNITEFDYLKKAGITVPVGYVVNFKVHGKDAKKFFYRLPDGEKLYFAYRSILTSVSSDYRKLMLFYGCPEKEAKEISSKKHTKHSESHLGEKNGSYGKRGINSNCFSPFKNKNNPYDACSSFMKDKNRQAILKWASNNDIDETNFEDLKFKYYSDIFKKIHLKKGEEFKLKNHLETTEEGVYLFNKVKSIKNFNAINFSEHCLSMIKKFGNEDEEIDAVRFLLEENYYELLSLSYAVRGLRGFKNQNITYMSKKFGEFRLRSKLEKGVLWIIDHLDICESVKYENVRIPYLYENRIHTYIIDFDVLLKTGNRILIEVKPYNQTILPEGKVLFKKNAADTYAKENNCVYLFVTEKDLKYELLRKKLQCL